MTFTLLIDASNDAFGDSDWERAEEIARILRNAADLVEQGGPRRVILRDCNGNTCGSYTVTAEG